MIVTIEGATDLKWSEFRDKVAKAVEKASGHGADPQLVQIDLLCTNKDIHVEIANNKMYIFENVIMSRDPYIFTDKQIRTIRQITAAEAHNRSEKMSDFRPLSMNEKHCLEKAFPGFNVKMLFSIADVSVNYTRFKGGFTIATIRLETEDKIYVSVGASRRSYKDKPNAIRGEILAFRRAIKTNPIIVSDTSTEDVPF